MPQSEGAPPQVYRCHPRSVRAWIGGSCCALLLAACGSLPTTMNSLPIPPDSVGLESNSLPSPLPASTPLSLTSELRRQLQIPPDQPVVLIESRGEDVIAQIPADEVMRWLGGEQWSGIEGLDLRLTVGEDYRETATAQLRMEQTALFTFSAPPLGSMEFEATAFSGLTTLATGEISFDASVLERSSESGESPLVPLVLEPTEDVPFLQGLTLAAGDSIPIEGGVVQDPLPLDQPITLTGAHLDQASEVLFATVFNPSGMTTRSGQILDRSPDTLRVRPPQGLALSSTTIGVRSESGLGLGSLNVTWKPAAASEATPLDQPITTPTPITHWQVESPLRPTPAQDLDLSPLDPVAVIQDAVGHVLLADQNRHQILLWDPEDGFQVWSGSGDQGRADGPRLEAELNTPTDLAWGITEEMWVVDRDNHQIRRITAAGEVITTAGSGEAGFLDSEDPLQAQFDQPSGLVVAPDGSLFVADAGNHRIRQILPSGEVITVAGTGEPGDREGAAERAQFRTPVGLALGPEGTLWIADRDNHRVRRLTPTGQVETVAGSEPGFVDGDLEGVRFRSPTAVALMADGSLLIADRDNHRIRRLQGQIVTTLAGMGQAGSRDGSAGQAQFHAPQDLWVTADGSILVVDQSTTQLRRILPIPRDSQQEQLSQTP